MSRFVLGDENKIKFYMLPKELFLGEYRGLSNNARVIYSLIIDRLPLSRKNKWMNSKKELYVKIKRKTIMYLLDIGKDTVAKNMKELSAYKLIDEYQSRRGEVSEIYPHQIKTQETEQMEITLEEEETLEESAIRLGASEEEIELIKEQIGYEQTVEFYNYFAETFPERKEEFYASATIFGKVTKAIFEVLTGKNKQYNINGNAYYIEEVKKQILKLKQEHVQTVVQNLLKTDKEIKSKNAFIIAALYNSINDVDIDNVLAENQALKDLKEWELNKKVS